MRENIGLYRGKRIDNGEWAKGFYVRLHDSKGHESHRVYSGYAETDCGDYYPDWHEVIPETIGEYSGLSDKNGKNGKRIFEGDIVKVKYGYCGNLKIPTNVRVEAVEYSPKFCCYEFYRWSGDIYEVEVIGNIHNNPELLEASGDE